MFMNDREEINMQDTFNNLIKKARDIQNLCSDDIVNTKDLRLSNDLKLNGTDLSDFAMSQLCGKVQVPTKYFNRLVENKQNDLAAENINVWLKDDKRKMMLRQFDGHIRGVMGGSYSRYDAPEILDSVKEVFGDKLTLKGSFLNEERLHLRLVETEMLPIEGEDLYAGITLNSSDIGRSSLAVKFFIYKQVCTNGLTIAKSSGNLFKQKHIGLNHEDFKDGLKAGLESFEEVKDKVVSMIKETHKIPLNSDIEALSEEVKAATKLSDDDIDQVMILVADRYEPTRWGLINGITEVAQKFSLERRLELEEIAGNMLA